MREHQTVVRTTVILLIAFVWVGCASTQKRYDKAVDLEGQGRYAEACTYYIRVLEKDRDFADARVRLAEAGAKAIEEYIARADAFLVQKNYVSAHAEYTYIDGLVGRAGAVGVVLDPPADLEKRKADTRSAGLRQLIDEAEVAVAEARWPRALDLYGRARTWPGVTGQQIREIDDAMARVHLSWARAEFDVGHFRSAFDHAAAVIAAVGPEHDAALAAIELQQRALEEGSILVAYLPMGRTDEVYRMASDLFSDDLNDVLLYDHWTVSRPFIIPADPIVVRRELRRVAGRGARVVSRSDAIELGRAVDVDFVVVGELTEYEEAERGVRETTHDVKTRGRNAQDTTYVTRRFTLERTAKVAYRIYDVRSRSTVDQGRTDAKASLVVERGEYAGDYRDLDLSGPELAYFDPDELDAQDEAVDTQLADALAVRLADEIFGRLIRLIP